MSAALEGESTQELRILRYPEVVKKVGLCRSEITTRVREGLFPRPVSLGKRAVGFPAHEVESFLTDLIARRRA